MEGIFDLERIKEISKRWFKGDPEKNETLTESPSKQILVMQRAKAIIKELAVPPLFKDINRASLRKPPNEKLEESYSIVLNYIDNFPKFLESGEGFFLEGGAGSGKTHIAYIIVNELLKRGFSAGVISVYDLSETGREEKWDRNLSKILDVLEDLDLLILDNLDTNMWESENQILFQVIDRRYKKKRPLIITTVESPESLEGRVNKGSITTKTMYSRLIEKCGSLHIHINGNFRKKLASEIDNRRQKEKKVLRIKYFGEERRSNK